MISSEHGTQGDPAAGLVLPHETLGGFKPLHERKIQYMSDEKARSIGQEVAEDFAPVFEKLAAAERLETLGDSALRAQRDAALDLEQNVRAINNRLLAENKTLKQCMLQLQNALMEIGGEVDRLADAMGLTGSASHIINEALCRLPDDDSI